MDSLQIVHMIQEAEKAGTFAYVPYSGYMVGAALLTENGKIYTGCNVECASYGGTNCAERTAIFKAVSEGERDFCAIAIVGKSKEPSDVFPDYAFPCGICRQVMLEFCKPDFKVIVAKNQQDYKVVTLEELIPYGFTSEI